MIRNIIFDFDGVVLESNNVKIEAFKILFNADNNPLGTMAVDFFKKNAGVSRYDVIDYYLSLVLPGLTQENIATQLSENYSKLVREKILNVEYVAGFNEFVTEKKDNLNFAIISSTDEKDLIYVCKQKGISTNIDSIMGSPTKKEKNIAALLQAKEWEKNETLYVGDSINDMYATLKNNIAFIARNSGIYDWSKHNNAIVINKITELNKIIVEIE